MSGPASTTRRPAWELAEPALAALAPSLARLAVKFVRLRAIVAGAIRSCPAGLDARGAAMLFLLAGALSVINAWTPGVAPAEARLPFTLLGLLDVAIAGVLAALPWDRWGRRALYAIPLVTLPVVDVFAIVGELDGWLYSMFFVALAVWVGLALPPWSNLWLAPPTRWPTSSRSWSPSAATRPPPRSVW
jgi:hypothetical protein